MTFKEKLNQLYVTIDAVEKSKKNKIQNYDYVPATAVIRAVRKAFIELRLYAEINTDFVGAPYTIAREKAPNAPFSAVNVKVTVKLIDLDSAETSTGSAVGSGADTGDKAAFKAETGTLKYALKNACLAPDERDPEADTTVDEGAAIPEYNDYRGTEATEPTEARYGFSSPARPEPPPPAEIPSNVPLTEELAPREPGDSDEMPSEEEMQGYRQAFAKLKTELEDAGLDSKGAPVGVKVRIFLQDITKTANPNDITRAAWVDFFARASNAKAKPNGLMGLVKLVNKANGIEK